MELIYDLWLDHIKGCGAVLTARLLEKFGSAEEVYREQEVSAFLEVEGVGYETAFALATQKDLAKARENAEMVESRAIPWLTLKCGAYPPMLREIHDPPSILYYKGKNVFMDGLPAVAIVGGRKATAYGLSAAQSIAQDLASAGVIIVSGLAGGIDAAAHKGALSVGGVTAGVLGCGVDMVYPSKNRELYQEILRRDGMLLSEFFPGTPPVTQNFPRRNRIISGLCTATLVVEAAQNSGSLITARFAAEQGREVYAVPGNITSSQSAGSNLLIQDGAKLVMTGRDILQDLFRVLRPAVPAQKKEAPAMSGSELEIYQEILRGSNTCDTIAKNLAKPIHEVNSAVTMLELKGLIAVEMGIIFLTP